MLWILIYVSILMWIILRAKLHPPITFKNKVEIYSTQPYTYNKITLPQQTIQLKNKISNKKPNISFQSTCKSSSDCDSGLVCANNICSRIIPVSDCYGITCNVTKKTLNESCGTDTLFSGTCQSKYVCTSSTFDSIAGTCNTVL